MVFINSLAMSHNGGAQILFTKGSRVIPLVLLWTVLFVMFYVYWSYRPWTQSGTSPFVAPPGGTNAPGLWLDQKLDHRTAPSNDNTTVTNNQTTTTPIPVYTERMEQARSWVDPFHRNATNSDDPCMDFYRDAVAATGGVVYPFFIDGVADKSRVAHSITLVTTLPADDLLELDRLSGFWLDGPISAAILIDDESKMDDLMDSYEEMYNINGREDVSIHLLLKNGTYFPTNTLRNLAMKYVATDHVFITEVELLPSSNLYDSAMSHVDKITGPQRLLRQMFVVPDFTVVGDRVPRYPASKKELKGALDAGRFAPRYSMSGSNITSRAEATNYALWRDSSEAYPVNYERGYAPFGILRTLDCPRFDEMLLDDRSTHLFYLEKLGLQLTVLPDVYTIFYKKRRKEKLPNKIAVDNSCLAEMVNASMTRIENLTLNTTIETTTPSSNTTIGNMTTTMTSNITYTEASSGHLVNSSTSPSVMNTWSTGMHATDGNTTFSEDINGFSGNITEEDPNDTQVL